MSEKQKAESGFARVFGAQPNLPHGTVVSVECDIVKGLHAFSVVGLPDKSVEEAKDRIAAAINNTNVKDGGDRRRLESPKRSNKKIVISLAPAGLKKEGAAFDLPIALAFLRASKQVVFDEKGKLFAGELALDGTLRPIRGVLSIATAARQGGFTDLFVPEENIEEAALVSGIRVFGIRSLGDALEWLEGERREPLRTRQIRRTEREEDSALDEIRGQEGAKRALVIAAAGAHNICFSGPPGTGKTLLARAARSILPDLAEEHMLEVTTIHSLAGFADGALTRPPFRSPHHTSSYASLIGGGSPPRPGEATLAHHGILFLDEFPEFHRDVIQALREPLEDRVVTVSRAAGTSVYPARFMLVAALNPCPCGFWGSSRCECMPHVVEKYRRKISGPIADRIDLWVEVGEMPPEALSAKRKGKGGETQGARSAVARAREKQAARFRGVKGISTNADMRAKHIEEFANLSPQAEEALIAAARRLKLSGRGYHRSVKLARTIADLAGSETIETPHMLEALSYRERGV